MKELLEDEFSKLRALISPEEIDSNEDVVEIFDNIDELLSIL